MILARCYKLLQFQVSICCDQMINTVSDRIRNIIKSQQQTPYHYLSKSRDNSIESGRSPSVIPHLPPRSPHKTSREEFVKSQQFSRQNATHSNQNQQIMEKTKQKVLQIVYPMLLELNKKIQIITQSQSFINGLIKDIQETYKSLSDVREAAYSHTKELTTRLEILQYKHQQSFEIQSMILQLKEEQLTINKRIDKINSNTQQLNIKNMGNTFYNAQPRQSVSYSLSKSPSTTTATFNANMKCKCEKLVEQILKSQNHLMMELKYIKHFQGISKSNLKNQK